MSPSRALLSRELMLALRSGGGTVQALVFFLIFVVMMPFGIGPEADLLAKVAPGALWLGALLACLLSLDRIFQTDAEDGTLDALALSPLPLEIIVAIKSLAHWLTTGLALTLLSPVLALSLSLPTEAMLWLVASLAVGTPALSLLGTIGASLTLGLRRGGLLVAILTLPLYVPTLIFGARTVSVAANGDLPVAAFALLAALTLAIIALAPFATAAVLRIQLR